MARVHYMDTGDISAAYAGNDPRFSRIVTRRLLEAMRDLGINPRKAYLRFFSLERREQMLALGTDRDADSPHRNRRLEEERGIGPEGYTYVHRLTLTYAIGEMGLAQGTHGVAIYGKEGLEYLDVRERYAAVFRGNPSEALLAVILPKDQEITALLSL